MSGGPKCYREKYGVRWDGAYGVAGIAEAGSIHGEEAETVAGDGAPPSWRLWWEVPWRRNIMAQGHRPFTAHSPPIPTETRHWAKLLTGLWGCEDCTEPPGSFQNVPCSVTAHWFGQRPTARKGRLSSPPLQGGMSFQRVTDDFLFGLVSLNWADAHKEANPWQPTAWGVSAPRKWVMRLFCSEPLSGPHRPG